jgi:hypothetical protein
MKTFIKCEVCNAEVAEEGCEFATHKRIIDGKEYVYCCIKCQQKHKKELSKT